VTASLSQCRGLRAGRLNLELLYEHLKARGVVFFEPPHEEPWERLCVLYAVTPLVSRGHLGFFPAKSRSQVGVD
jgi:hypothetical protein